MIGSRKLGAAVLGSLLATAAGAGTAQALPGGPWASSSAPISVNYAGWKPVGYSYGIFEGYREDEGRGSRIQDWSAARAVAGYNGGDRGAYTKHSWFWNGSYCYVNSYSTTGGGIACSSGWHGAGSSNSGSNPTSSYRFSETWYGADPEADSGRGQMQTCWDVAWAPDVCSSAYLLRGAHYG